MEKEYLLEWPYFIDEEERKEILERLGLDDDIYYEESCEIQPV